MKINTHKTKYFSLLTFITMLLFTFVLKSQAQNQLQGAMASSIVKNPIIAGYLNPAEYVKHADSILTDNTMLLDNIGKLFKCTRDIRQGIANWGRIKDIIHETGIKEATFSCDYIDFESGNMEFVIALSFDRAYTLKTLSETFSNIMDEKNTFLDDENWINDNTVKDDDYMIKMVAGGRILLFGTENTLKQAERQINRHETIDLVKHFSFYPATDTYMWAICDLTSFIDTAKTLLSEEIPGFFLNLPELKTFFISASGNTTQLTIRCNTMDDVYGIYHLFNFVKYTFSKTNIVPDTLKNELLSSVKILPVSQTQDVTVEVSEDKLAQIVKTNQNEITRSIYQFAIRLGMIKPEE